MAKATKRKREGTADFKKTKTKLGKGKQIPTNATNTSFKARSIALPEQSQLSRSLAQSEGTLNGEAITSTGLMIDEVIIKLRHPNHGVKIDSLMGIKEIMVADRAYQQGKDASKILRAFGGIVSDENENVRKALSNHLERYLVNTNKSALTPHLPLLLLQITSALSHIYPDIRIDAAKLILKLLEHVPNEVVGDWPKSSGSSSSAGGILESLRLALGLPGQGGSSSSGKVGSVGKLIFMQALKGFVDAALSKDRKGKGKEVDDIFEGWLAEPKNRDHGVYVHVEDQVDNDYGYLVPGGSWSLEYDPDQNWEIGRIEDTTSANLKNDNNDVLTPLFLQLQPLLLSTFLEAAPSAFAPDVLNDIKIQAGTTRDITLCQVCCSLAATLSSAIIADTSSSDSTQVRIGIAQLLKRMSIYFPFNQPKSLEPGIDTELNLAYASMATLLDLEISTLHKGTNAAGMKMDRRNTKDFDDENVVSASKGKHKNEDSMARLALEKVGTWLIDLMTPTKDALRPSMIPDTFTSLLPIIWSLLSQPPSPTSNDEPYEGKEGISESIGIAFFNYTSTLSNTSTIRALSDQFIINLIWTHEQRFPRKPFSVPSSSGQSDPGQTHSKVRDWIKGIPRRLFELGGKDDSASERLLLFLLEMGMRGGKGTGVSDSLLKDHSGFYQDIGMKLAPYFHIDHPTKGSFSGPYLKLPSTRIRKLALEVGKVWTEFDSSETLIKALRSEEIV